MTWLIAALVKFFCTITAMIPRKLQMRAGSALGLFWFYVVPIRRRVAIENLKKAFPGWTDQKIWSTARANFKNYGCGFLEFLLLPVLDEKRVKELLEIEGLEYFEKAKSLKKGIFFLTLHLGSWELMSASSLALNIKLNVITKKIKRKSLNAVWTKMRLAKGLRLISEEKSTFEILRAIRRQEVVGFILDQFMGPPVGTRVKFFGIETGAPAALALFADRTRAPVIPVYNVRLPNGKIRVVLEEPIPFMEQGSIEKNISFMTQVYTSKIEEIVKRYPEQWLWIHRRWKPFRE